MRRAQTSGGISPKQLKHFAIAAVAVTGLLALFASGEDWGAKAQIEAAEAKSRAKLAENKALGSKVNTAMAVRKPDTGAGFGDSAGVGAGGGGSGGSGGSGGDQLGTSSASSAFRPTHLPAVAPRAGESFTIDGKASDMLMDPKARITDHIQKGVVTRTQSAKIRDASRKRSGAPEQGD